MLDTCVVHATLFEISIGAGMFYYNFAMDGTILAWYAMLRTMQFARHVSKTFAGMIEQLTHKITDGLIQINKYRI